LHYHSIVDVNIIHVPPLESIPTRGTMSDQEDVRPFHAKDSAPGQEAADVVAEVLRHAAERDQAAGQKTPPKAPPKWMLPVGINLGVLAFYFLVAQPDWVVIDRIAPPAAEVQIQSTRSAMWLHGISRIEGYRSTNGRLPQSLEEAGGAVLATEGVLYVPRPDSTYMLIATVGDVEITYDSAIETPEQFAGNLSEAIAG
jgi:hypothetical protein